MFSSYLIQSRALTFYLHKIFGEFTEGSKSGEEIVYVLLWNLRVQQI
jgi:hypothetical protein